jgi:hypothetical protein
VKTFARLARRAASPARLRPAPAPPHRRPAPAAAVVHGILHRPQLQPKLTAGPNLAVGIGRAIRGGAPSGVIRRAQIGGVNPSSGTGPPFFVYELDAAISTFSGLAVHYGVGTGSIGTLNPTARPTALRLGQRINVPAFDPPAAGSWPVGPPVPGVVQSTATAPVDVRWNTAANANRVGRVRRGTSIGEIGGGVWVNRSDLSDQAPGLLAEMAARALAGPTFIFAFIPAANLRSLLTPVPAAHVNLIARMIWGEQRSQGTQAMVAAAWIARNRFDGGWGSYADIITPAQFHGIASATAVTGLTGADLTRWTEAQTIAQEVVDGTRADPTGGAPFFGNGTAIETKMRACTGTNPAFTFGNIRGTNFFFSNGDYTSSACTVP